MAEGDEAARDSRPIRGRHPRTTGRVADRKTAYRPPRDRSSSTERLEAEAADSEVVAGIDLGSNSFHMIVVRSQGDGRVHVLDKIKEPVRLAAGLNDDREIDADAQFRALDALERFAQRLRELPAAQVRAVGTNTLRQAKNGASFLERAEQALGHEIDVISGPEEARLIYLGVAHSSYHEEQRLVMDIGGGSTELIIGEGFVPRVRDSLYMGCVSFSKRFFSKGRISEKNFREAELAAQRELLSLSESYKKLGWSRCTGASGTLKAVDEVLRVHEWSQQGITRDGLDALRDTLIDAKKVDKLDLDGLETDRAPVFAGGVAIVRAAFDILGIEVMDVSDGALREGVAYELLGRSTRGDVRDETVRSFAERYRVDPAHAERVERTALQLFEQVRTPWTMLETRSRKFIRWASLLHEIGLSIAYSGNHKHAAYLVRNSEMPGFSREQQAMLAAILENQRRRFKPKRFEKLAPDRRVLAQQLAVLLRLAILLNRARSGETVPEVDIVRATDDHLDLLFPEGWLDRHPLTRADLVEEADYLTKIELELGFR